ncbi:MAG: hypothetical protein V1923_01435 [Candidatus Omnitrophota bacterium]
MNIENSIKITKETKLVKGFVLVINILFGLNFGFFLCFHLFGLLSKFLGFGLVGVNYKSIYWQKEIYYVFLTSGILISNFFIKSFRKFGVMLFLAFFTAIILNKICIVIQEWSSNNAMGVAAMFISFILDGLLFSFFLAIFLRKTVWNQLQ